MEDGYELLLSGYRGYLKSRNASDATIVKWDGYAYRFLGYLSFVGVAAISDLAPDDVSGFVKWVTARHAATGMAGELSMLRSFLGYTDDALLTAGAEKWVPRGRNIAAAPTPTLEDGELARIVAAIDTSTSMGKRDLLNAELYS